MGVVKGAILLDVNNFNILLSLRLSSLSPLSGSGNSVRQLRVWLLPSGNLGTHSGDSFREGDALLTQEEECKGLFEGLQTELEEVTEALAEVIARSQLTLSLFLLLLSTSQALPENSAQDCDPDS